MLPDRVAATAGIPERVTAVLAEILPGPCALHEPEFAGREAEYVAECIAAGWVSTAGAYVNRFEEDLCAFTGAAHAVATNNGTAALHLCLRVLGLGAGDEVIVPALSFVATANAVAYTGAACHFADISPDTLGLDPAKLEDGLREFARMESGACVNRASGRPLRAVIAVNAFGHPADMPGLHEVCARWNLALVEDAAESLGSTVGGRHAGTFGRLAALSFNGNKIVTTGGGGAVLTGDAELARRARHLSTTAKLPHAWAYDHDELGHNYRLPNLNAALGCAQLGQLPGFVADKRRLAERYARAFAAVPGVRFFTEPAGTRSNYWLNALVLDDPADLEPLLARSNAAGFGTRPAWRPLADLPMYVTAPRMDLSVTEDMAARLINLPSSARLGRAAA